MNWEPGVKKRRNRPIVRRGHGCRVSLAASAVSMVVSIGMASAPSAHAQDAGAVLDQAGQELAQASQVLDSAPLGSVDPQAIANILDAEERMVAVQEEFLAHFESVQAGLPATDQTNPVLLAADYGLLSADTRLLDTTEAFVTAIQSGDLTTAQAVLDVAGPLLVSDYGALPFDINVSAVDCGAQLAATLGNLGADLLSLF